MTVKEDDVIRIPVTKEMMETANRNARLKAEHTINTWLSNRSPQERYATLFPGDLAKVATCIFLLEANIPFEDYDEIRTNDFKESDPWDIRVKKRYLIEVKSSLEKEENCPLAKLIKTRNLMTYPGKERDINIQAYFLPKDTKRAFDRLVREYEAKWPSRDLLFELGEVYLMGWLPKDELIKRKTWTMPPRGYRETSRQQYDAKIETLKKMSELPKYISNL